MTHCRTRRLGGCIALVAIALVVAACGPVVTIHNDTTIPVRTIVTNAGASQVFSTSPGEGSISEVTEGAFRVTAIPDAEWIDWARDTRAYLNRRLASAGDLTGPQLLDVVQRLKDIARKIQAYEAAAGSTATCSGSVTSDADGMVIVTQAPGGSLVVSCK